MEAWERRAYALILILAVALAGLSGYAIAALPARTGYHPPPQNGGSEAQLRTITVTGFGKASAQPNLAVLRLGVYTEAANATEALTRNSEIANAVIEELVSLGISKDNIETCRFSLSPKYSRDGLIIGFEVLHMLQVSTSQLDLVGRIIDQAVSAGANRVDAVYFTFTEEKAAELKELARRRAAEDARLKAEVIAQSLGVRVVGVMSATEETFTSPYRFKVEIAETPTPVTPIMPPSEVEVTVLLRVVFIIE